MSFIFPWSYIFWCRNFEPKQNNNMYINMYLFIYWLIDFLIFWSFIYFYFYFFLILGPSADHNGNSNGYYLYMEVSGRQGGEKARILVTPRFQG